MPDPSHLIGILVQEFGLWQAMALQFDPAGLGFEWDGIDTIRDRLRAGKRLIVEGKEKGNDGNIQECVANQDTLVPVLTRLLAANLKLPSLPGLRREVDTLYTKNNRTPDDSTVDDDAWDVRKLLRFVKRKGNRNDPSMDTSMHLNHTYFFGLGIFFLLHTVWESLPSLPKYLLRTSTSKSWFWWSSRSSRRWLGPNAQKNACEPR